MQLRNFTAAPGLVNLKVSYFVFFFFFFLKKGLKCSCLPIIRASSHKSKLSAAFSESNILDC